MGPTTTSPAPTISRCVNGVVVDCRERTGVRQAVVVTRGRGTGRRIVTGNVGVLCLEAANVAISLVGVRLDELGRLLGASCVLDGGSLEMCGYDVHIDLPGGDMKKEGFSVGLPICVGLVAMSFGKQVAENVGFTGEVDLCGNVLAVGDVEQKLEGACRMGLDKMVIPLPSYQELDLDSLSPDIRSYVSTHVFPP